MYDPIQTRCFKAYDIRGQVPTDLNEDIAYRIGRALVAQLGGRSYVVGRDMRLESPSLSRAVMKGLSEGGADVIDIGLCGTEEVYFATSHYQADGGIMVTASHNPKGYNGMKLVREQSRPISGDTGLNDIRQRVETGDLGIRASCPGAVREAFGKTSYIDHLLTYIDLSALKPLKVLADPGNGAAGPVLELLKARLSLDISVINGEPDGHFPNGIPNPLLPENRDLTRQAVLDTGADIGIAFDGDFDRCFFFDNDGRFIEGYYVVGLLAEMLLAKHPGSKIIHDPRLTWNTIEQVHAAGGQAIQSKTGHAFIKERMRAEDAVYGGEMSAHHYFRDFAYCDSGMIPWLLVVALISSSGLTLSEMVDRRIRMYPCSGEVNYKVKDAEALIESVQAFYQSSAIKVERVDGLSMEFETWRFNVRSSNTEPLLRLNVEAKEGEDLEKKFNEVERLIKAGASSC
ncbi:phosphomannomutase [Pseudomonas asiatica]|uniref:phosphomannomutase n=1 Tax=Pseudomonas asiatica TaxID=2219225 RepID=UPI0025A25985|nr:phosphomannomutase [Pseudomonas asiatica]WJM54977.1 phosphomannomutase [Pseudomonas asiatica]